MSAHNRENCASRKRISRMVGLCLALMSFTLSASGQKLTDLKVTADPTSGPVPLTVSFSAESVPPPELATWDEYTWDFGDNVVLKGIKTTRRFDNPGPFKVTVTCSRRNPQNGRSYGEVRRTLTVTVLAPTPAQAAPAIQVTPATLNFNTVGGSNPQPASLRVSNIGGGRFIWSASNDSAKWLTLSQTKGVLPGGVGVNIAVQAISSGFAVGSYQAKLTFSTDGNLRTSVVVIATLAVAAQPTRPAAPAVTEPIAPRSSKFIWWVIPVAVVLGGALMLARKGPKRNRAQPLLPQVKLTLGTFEQKVEAGEPLLSLFLRVRVRCDASTPRVSAQARLIEKITKPE